MLHYMKFKSLEDVCETLHEEGNSCVVLAGGTDLLVRPHPFEGKRLVLDITRIEALRHIKSDGLDWVVVGAAATHQEIADNRMISRRAHVLGLASRSIGSYQIRNRATLGGNLANASPAADTLPALVCLDAQVEIVSKDQIRSVDVSRLFSGPGAICIEPHELIFAVRIPVHSGRGVAFFKKIGQRKGMSCAKASVAFCATRHADGRLTNVRMALGAVAPTVVEAKEAEQVLEGRVLTLDLVQAAAEACQAPACPIDDTRSTMWYRKRMVSALAAEGLHEVFHHIQKFRG